VTAQNGLVDSLERFGNKLSIPHRKALYTLVESFTNMAEGKLTGRWAFPIPTGCGKTRAIIEWATAVSKRKDPHSMVVSASRIEALCTMKRDMIANGIPAEQIGLVYRPVYQTDSKGKQTKKLVYSEPFTEDNESRPFLLCSHQLIRARESNLDLYNTYKGQPRSVVVYDESLLVSDIEHFTVESLCQSIYGWIGKFKFSQDAVRHTNILNWLNERKARIEYAFTNYDSDGVNDLPEPTFEIPLDEAAAYERLFRKEGDEVMADFLAINGLPLRLIRHGKTAVVSYRIVIPEALSNMLVLDASYPIRKLEQSDVSLFNAEALPSCKNFQVKFDTLKRFDRVTLYRMAHHGGRTSAVQNKTKMRRLMQDVVKVVKDIPTNEGVLIFVYKERFNRNPKRLLEIELERAGVKPRPTLTIETWGNETSLNSYSYCKHVILVGVLHRDLSELETQLLGQVDNLNKKVELDDLQAIALSERAHCAYQAFSRGACRIMGDAGQASQMTGYVIEYDEGLETELTKVMPGATWKTWEPVYADSVAHGKLVLDLATKLQGHIEKLPTSVGKVSSRRLRADLKAEAVASQTWTRVMKRALDGNPQWIQQGQSISRAA
jgi:hypothetical protein